MNNPTDRSEFLEWTESEETPCEEVVGRVEGAEKIIEMLEKWLLSHPKANHVEILDYLETQIEDD